MGETEERVLDAGAALELRQISKSYRSQPVVSELTLAVRKGELLTLLGPSGCGKTTTLRMVAGFVAPTSGEILVRGQSVARMPVHKRGVGLVFQDYALFPHMTVAKNVAFGLRRRGVSRRRSRELVADILDRVQLSDFASRLPSQLSGGQQQRVALARVLVLEPEVILLDEPFSNLDAVLRRRLRTELRELQQRLGLTAVFVTHDQEEAMTISDRVALMRAGVVEQLDTPDNLYNQPVSRFAAEFIGQSNIITGVVRSSDEQLALIETDFGTMSAPLGAARTRVADGQSLAWVLRPERVRLSVGGQPGPETDNTVNGTVSGIEHQGASVLIHLTATSGVVLKALVPSSAFHLWTVGNGLQACARWSAADMWPVGI